MRCQLRFAWEDVVKYDWVKAGRRMIRLHGELGCYSWDFDVYYNAWRLVTLASFTFPVDAFPVVVRGVQAGAGKAKFFKG